jgi:hypothetical protein
MAEQDFSKKEKNYYTDIPQKSEAFFLKGSNGYDWGMRNRLARIFNPRSGKTVMGISRDPRPDSNALMSPSGRSSPLQTP